MEDQKLIQRMYGLVLYSLSGIQKGIQYGHAVVEYGMAFPNDPDYKQWSAVDKTSILLSGGSTNNNPDKLGTLNKHFHTLLQNMVKCVIFNEPDLGDQVTAVVFLVDERVWNKEKYPDFDQTQNITYLQWSKIFSKDQEEINKVIFLREFLKQFKLA